MYTLRRITTGAPMRIMVDHKTDEADGGFGYGGTFEFASAGEEGDTLQVSEHAARAIMGDPGLAEQFTCEPALAPLPVETPVETPAAKPTKKRAAVADDGA